MMQETIIDENNKLKTTTSSSQKQGTQISQIKSLLIRIKIKENFPSNKQNMLVLYL